MQRFKSARLFRLWDWNVSHCQLLIRSPRNEDDPSQQNVDLAFSGVFYVELVDTLSGIEVASASTTDSEYLKGKADPGTDGQYYVLESGGRKYFVGAVHIDISENRLPFMQSSLVRPPPPTGSSVTSPER